MPLNPPPTVQTGLCLITQSLQRGDLARQAQLTYAVRNPTLLTTQQVANEFQASFNTNITLNFDSDVTAEPTFVRQGNGTRVVQEAVASGAAGTGLASPNVAPSNVAYLWKKTTGTGGKKNRGRTYVPWIVQNGQVSEIGVIDSTTTAFWLTQLETFRADLITRGIPMVIANRTLVITPPQVRPHVDALTTGPDVISYAPEKLVATQRRRLGR
jgi:hypothetical protein